MLDNDGLAQYYFNWMSDYKEWARLWKQVAKKWRQRAHVYEAMTFHRLEMLRKMELEVRVIESAMCPFCGFYEHGPYCELAKELSDD